MAADRTVATKTPSRRWSGGQDRFRRGRRSQRNLCGNRQRRSISKIDHYLLNLHQFPIAPSCTLMREKPSAECKSQEPAWFASCGTKRKIRAENREPD